MCYQHAANKTIGSNKGEKMTNTKKEDNTRRKNTADVRKYFINKEKKITRKGETIGNEDGSRVSRQNKNEKTRQNRRPAFFDSNAAADDDSIQPTSGSATIMGFE